MVADGLLYWPFEDPRFSADLGEYIVTNSHPPRTDVRRGTQCSKSGSFTRFDTRFDIRFNAIIHSAHRTRAGVCAPTSGRCCHATWPTAPPTTNLEAAIAQLEPRLQSPSTYSGPDTQATLAQSLYPLALSHTLRVRAILSQQLQTTLPTVSASLFENKVEESATDVARWYVLWAMGLNGQGDKVPVHFLSEPWTTPDNDREKYWQIPPAAMWTVAQLNQADQQTIAALIQRLSDTTDPLWLTGDVVGALSQLTHQRLGYDRTAWQNWWKAEE